MNLGLAIFLIILVGIIASLLLVITTQKKGFVGLIAILCCFGIIACGMGHREAQVKAAKQSTQNTLPSLRQQVEERQNASTNNTLPTITDQTTDSEGTSDQTTNTGNTASNNTTNTGNTASNNTTTTAPSSEGRAAADACMEQEYGKWNYTFQSANESNATQKSYTYKVTKSSNILTEVFDVVVNYETSYRRAHITQGSITEMYDPRSPTWDDLTTRTWNLTGTWVYRDSQRDFTVTISNVSGDTVTMQYNLSGYKIDTTPAGKLVNDNGKTLSSNGSVQVQIQPYLGTDDNQWSISHGANLDGNGFVMWLNPFGSTQTTGGDGSGSILSLDGCQLTRR